MKRPVATEFMGDGFNPNKKDRKYLENLELWNYIHALNEYADDLEVKLSERQQQPSTEKAPETEALRIGGVSNSALPPLPELAAANFDAIVKLSQRLTTGNISHKSRTIEGLAKRNAEFIRKHYC